MSRGAGSTLDGGPPDAADPAPIAEERPARPWSVLRGPLAMVAVGGTIAVLALLVATVAPALTARVPALNKIVRELTVDALLLTLAGVVFGAWVRRRRARLAGTALMAAAIATTVALLFPIVALWRVAASTGTSLSLLGNTRHQSNYGLPQPNRTVTYTTVNGRALELDVWAPEVTPAAGRRPAIVWVHGGGWFSGNRSMTPLLNQWFVDHGYVVFDIEYRLAPPARWDEAPADVACAVSWARANAATYQVDPTRIVLAGESSGGQLALEVAYRPSGSSSCAAGDDSVAAVVALYPASDLTRLYEADTRDGTMNTWLRSFLGGSPSEVPERYRAASPITHVRPGLPPTLLIHGADDDVITAAQTETLAQMLAVNGDPHQAVILPFADHAFDHAWGALPTQITRQLIVDYLAAELT